MANELQVEFSPRIYNLEESRDRKFSEFMANQATMGANIQNSIDTQTLAMVASQAALANTMNQGFSAVSNKLGYMGAAFSMGLDRVSSSLNKLSKDICDRLDKIADIANNPRLTQSRELFRSSLKRYNDGFFEDALEDIKAALEKEKTDYISWFLEGMIYLIGAGKFSNVIDLDLAIAAFTNAAKYIDPNIAKAHDAKLMAAEIYLYWGIAQYAKSNDLLRVDKKAEAADMLMKARKAFEQSYQYSANMLESLFNAARCKTIQGEADRAIGDLETLVLSDRNYFFRVYADSDFSSIGTQFDALLIKLKHKAFIPAKNDYDRINTLLSELASLGGTTTVTLPSTFTEELPYFDILDYGQEFKKAISTLEKAIADKRHEEEERRKAIALKRIEAAERQRERREWEAQEERSRLAAEKERRELIIRIIIGLVSLGLTIIISLWLVL